MDLGAAPAPPKKRSLFSQKALSKKNKADLEESLTFSRAKELEAERLAEEERQRRKRLNKIERKRSGQSVEREQSPAGNENIVDPEITPKRRRVSVDLEDVNGKASQPRNHADTRESPRRSKVSGRESPSQQQEVSSSSAQRSPSSTLTARYNKAIRDNLPRPPTTDTHTIHKDEDSEGDQSKRNLVAQHQNAIIIDDEDEPVVISKLPAREPSVNILPSDDDEEFPELVQRARERERLRQEATNAAKASSEQSQSQDSYKPSDTQPKVDPSISILISSNLEGTVPLRVKRKMSQRLREARYAWCDRQNMPQYTSDSLKSQIFLTWKRKRVYDSTTCTALGLPSDDSESFSDDAEAVKGNIHLEAWTEETFAAYEQEEAAAKLREEQGHDDDQDDSPPPEQVVRYRLILKAKDLEPVKLVVKSDTLLERLIAAFRQKSEIPEDKEVSLYFDGDELDPQDTVEDAELDDLDNVEVHIK